MISYHRQIMSQFVQETTFDQVPTISVSSPSQTLQEVYAFLTKIMSGLCRQVYQKCLSGALALFQPRNKWLLN